MEDVVDDAALKGSYRETLNEGRGYIVVLL